MSQSGDRLKPGQLGTAVETALGARTGAAPITGDTGSMNPVGLYAECSTMATIVILFVYLLTMLSLPVFMWRRHRDSFSPIRHVGGLIKEYRPGA